MKKIAVLMGGISSERDISIASGKAVSKALNLLGYDVSEILLESTSFDIDNKEFDLVFIALHGSFGEDGQIQSILEEKKINFTGSSKDSCLKSFDKIVTRNILIKHNILVPIGEVINSPTDLTIPFPIVIKPPTEGSSIGCHLVKNQKEFNAAFKSTSSISTDVLVEEYIPGREITVGIVEGKVLPVVEIIPSDEWYDFNAKYKNNETLYDIPAKLDKLVSKNLQTIAMKVFDLLGASGFARIDFRLTNDNKAYVLELNSIPGFTEKSLLPKAAKSAGISFSELCKIIVLSS